MPRTVNSDPDTRATEISRARADRINRAREIMLRNAAHRAVDDPATLARAARIVRAALARQRLALEDLTPLPDPDADARSTR